jgi:hypothetical protein
MASLDATSNNPVSTPEACFLSDVEPVRPKKFLLGFYRQRWYIDDLVSAAVTLRKFNKEYDPHEIPGLVLVAGATAAVW